MLVGGETRQLGEIGVVGAEYVLEAGLEYMTRLSPLQIGILGKSHEQALQDAG